MILRLLSNRLNLLREDDGIDRARQPHLRQPSMMTVEQVDHGVQTPLLENEWRPPWTVPGCVRTKVVM